MNRHHPHGVTFESIQDVEIGDTINLRGSGILITVTDKLPSMRRGGTIYRSLVTQVGKGSAPIPGFDHGTLCTLTVTDDSTEQVLVPLNSSIIPNSEGIPEVQPMLRVIR